MHPTHFQATTSSTGNRHTTYETEKVWVCRPWANPKMVEITIPKRRFIYNVQPAHHPSLESRSFDQRTTSAASVTIPPTASALSSLSSFVGSYNQQYHQPVAGSSQMTQGLDRGFRLHPSTSTHGATSLRQLLHSEGNLPRPFQCEYCHSRFPDLLNLAVHRITEHDTD